MTTPLDKIRRGSRGRVASEIFALSGRRRTLSTVVEIYGRPIREAVATISGAFTKHRCSMMSRSLISHCKRRPPTIVRSDAEMAGWAIVSMWVVGVAVKALSVNASLTDAEQWFFGLRATDRSMSPATAESIIKAEDLLRSTADAVPYLKLLPYILDPHGPGNRVSVKRNPATSIIQARKRTEGVFYTPADVAEYMADACLSELDSDTLPTVFDPACGTGVFLRAALREIRNRHPERDNFSLASECLFGADIDPWPLDASAFVLLADSWAELADQRTLPAAAWHQLRLNLACIDTLLIDPVESGCNKGEPAPSKHERRQNERVSVSQLFPTLHRGPTVILGNPPYVDLGQRSDITELAQVYKTVAIKPTPNAEVYIPFLEQMIRLADPETCSAALVLPLSIACNTGQQFSTARELISDTPGRWRFAFFDREPQALFGEDVKTRSAIVLWSRVPSSRTVTLASGPLRRWRVDTRATMFRNLQFTAVNCDIQAGIPKVEGDLQATALARLATRDERFEQAVHLGRVKLADTSTANDTTVFISPTAYNFLNVFMKPERGLFRDIGALSEHSLHAVSCSSISDAFTAFAILSSRFAYWWWHTHGDGFHVSTRFISGLPFGLEAFSAPTKDVLASRGSELWSAIKANPIISINRARTSLAYTPKGHDEIRRGIDQALVDLAKLDRNFVEELHQFTMGTIAAMPRQYSTSELVPTGRR